MNVRKTARRVILYVVLNIIIMAVICLGVYFGLREEVSQSVVERADEMLRGYMVTVKNSNLHLEQIEPGYSDEFGDLISPYIDIALYRRRASGETDFVTANDFIMANDPPLTYQDGIHTEIISGATFRTYTERIYPEQGEYYEYRSGIREPHCHCLQEILCGYAVALFAFELPERVGNHHKPAYHGDQYASADKDQLLVSVYEVLCYRQCGQCYH